MTDLEKAQRMFDAGLMMSCTKESVMPAGWGCEVTADLLERAKAEVFPILDFLFDPADRHIDTGNVDTMYINFLLVDGNLVMKPDAFILLRTIIGGGEVSMINEHVMRVWWD